LNPLQHPDEIKNIFDRRRPANAFPQVFAGHFTFLVEVAARMEKTRPVAMETGVQSDQLIQTPRQRTRSLANASRPLKRERSNVTRRRHNVGIGFIPSLREIST
jgi:hypothetical protein